jgi:hypothetical protein
LNRKKLGISDVIYTTGSESLPPPGIKPPGKHHQAKEYMRQEETKTTRGSMGGWSKVGRDALYVWW